jgi:hypothetical protein
VHDEVPADMSNDMLADMSAGVAMGHRTGFPSRIQAVLRVEGRCEGGNGRLALALL